MSTAPAPNEIVTRNGTLRTYRVGAQWSCARCRYRTTMRPTLGSAHRMAALHISRKHAGAAVADPR